MNEKEFIFAILVAIFVFIAVMTIVAMYFIIFLRQLRFYLFTDVVGDLEDTVNRMSRDASISKTYVYKLGHCVQELKDCLNLCDKKGKNKA